MSSAHACNPQDTESQGVHRSSSPDAPSHNAEDVMTNFSDASSLPTAQLGPLQRLWPVWCPSATPGPVSAPTPTTFPNPPSFSSEDGLPSVYFHGMGEQAWSQPATHTSFAQPEDAFSNSSTLGTWNSSSSSSLQSQYAAAPLMRARSRSYDECLSGLPGASYPDRPAARASDGTWPSTFRFPFYDEAAAVYTPGMSASPVTQQPLLYSPRSLPYHATSMNLDDRRSSFSTAGSSHLSPLTTQQQARHSQLGAGSASPGNASRGGLGIGRSRARSGSATPVSGSPYSIPITTSPSQVLQAPSRPSLKGWTLEDDLLIIKLKQQEGRSWSQIQRRFPDKRASAIQVHYSRHLSRLTAEQIAAMEVRAEAMRTEAQWHESGQAWQPPVLAGRAVYRVVEEMSPYHGKENETVQAMQPPDADTLDAFDKQLT